MRFFRLRTQLLHQWAMRQAALKTRNSIIFGPHPRGINVCKVVVDLFRKELAKLGLPEDLVLCLEEVSLEDSNKLMSMVDEIVATGGPGMVKAVTQVENLHLV